MLPLLTWEPRQTVQVTKPSDEPGPVTDGLTLASIINGEHDDYITKYAAGRRGARAPRRRSVSATR